MWIGKRHTLESINRGKLYCGGKTPVLGKLAVLDCFSMPRGPGCDPSTAIASALGISFTCYDPPSRKFL